MVSGYTGDDEQDARVKRATPPAAMARDTRAAEVYFILARLTLIARDTGNIGSVREEMLHSSQTYVYVCICPWLGRRDRKQPWVDRSQNRPLVFDVGC